MNQESGFKREYYRLADAAQKLGVTEDDLLHLGATRRAVISAPVLHEGTYSWGRFSVQLVQRPELGLTVLWFDASMLVALTASDVAMIEATGRTRVTSFIYSPAALEEYEGVVFKYDEMTPELYPNFTYTEQKHLFIRADELSRLLEGRELNAAQQAALATSSLGGKEIGETQRASLLKQVAALALLLAEKSNRYRNGDAPNANQIADAVTELLEALPDAKTRGAGKSSVRESIKAGIALLTE